MSALTPLIVLIIACLVGCESVNSPAKIIQLGDPDRRTVVLDESNATEQTERPELPAIDPSNSGDSGQGEPSASGCITGERRLCENECGVVDLPGGRLVRPAPLQWNAAMDLTMTATVMSMKASVLVQAAPCNPRMVVLPPVS